MTEKEQTITVKMSELDAMIADRVAKAIAMKSEIAAGPGIVTSSGPMGATDPLAGIEGAAREYWETRPVDTDPRVLNLLRREGARTPYREDRFPCTWAQDGLGVFTFDAMVQYKPRFPNGIVVGAENIQYPAEIELLYNPTGHVNKPVHDPRTGQLSMGFKQWRHVSYDRRAYELAGKPASFLDQYRDDLREQREAFSASVARETAPAVKP
jgi:hypothetical protein